MARTRTSTACKTVSSRFRWSVQRQRSACVGGGESLGLLLAIGGAPKFQLFANHGADAEAAVGGHVLSDKVIKQAAEGVTLVVAEHGAGAERLAHLLEEHRREHAFEGLAGVLRRRAGVWRLAYRPRRDRWSREAGVIGGLHGFPFIRVSPLFPRGEGRNY